MSLSFSFNDGVTGCGQTFPEFSSLVAVPNRPAQEAEINAVTDYRRNHEEQPSFNCKRQNDLERCFDQETGAPHGRYQIKGETETWNRPAGREHFFVHPLFGDRRFREVEHQRLREEQ